MFPKQIMERTSYEFFAGLDASGTPIWTRDLLARHPPSRIPKASDGVSASFNSGLGRYLLMTEDTSRGQYRRFRRAGAVGTLDHGAL